MADAWWSVATKDGRSWQSGAYSGNSSSRRVVVHSTENSVGTNPKGIADYMWNNAGSGTGYHILMPLSSSYRPLQLRGVDGWAGGLKNNGTLKASPNKQGSLVIQVALICYAKDNKGLSDLGPYWGDFLAFTDAWGVPREWFGPLPAGGGVANKMSTDLWYSSTSGWSAHATTPNPNSTHWDPGKIDTGVLFSGQGGTAPPPQEWDGNASFHRNLLRKDPMMKGEDVKWVQNKVAVGADGIFGDQTKSAVTSWQSHNGLGADGVVGPDTAAAMGMPGATGSTPPAPSGGSLGPFPLPSGHWFGQVSSNPSNHSGTGHPSDHPDRVAIRKIQGRVGKTQDGIYGPNTETGVKSWQSSHGLAADGDCGVKTWNSM